MCCIMCVNFNINRKVFTMKKMSNERYNQLIDEAYEKYCKSFENQSTIEQYSFDTDPMSQLMFIGKIKTISEFSEKWGLKIEERVLTLKERNDYYTSNYLGLDCESHEELNKLGDIPTKLITVTYNNEKTEVYE